jgi:hypothetical protein
MRFGAGVVLSVVLASSVLAQEAADPWRETVTGQIEAFRAGDAAGALELAGAGFKSNYEDPDVFMADIERAGYGPILTSRSHSFGEFRSLADGGVIQVVNLVGPDQSLYEAVYQLADEPGEGWRVQSVVMRKAEGLGI